MHRRALLAIPAVAVVALPLVWRPARADDTTWVIEPTPEATDAVSAGAADLARAQKLAKQKKLVDAVDLLEQLDRAHPAALHDCNLALAYLRAGALTRAELLWDVSALRNADRPDWCTGDLGKQLSTALHAAGFVPLTLAPVPPDAVVSVGGVTVKNVHVVWLPPGQVTVSGHADGYVDASQDVTLASPSGSVTIALARPVVEADAAPIAVDAAPPVVVDAAPVIVPPPPPPPRAPRAEWPGWVGLGVGVVSAAGGVAFHVGAVDARDQGNTYYTFQPELADATSRFDRDRNLAIASYAVSAAATGFFVWWWTHR